MIESEMFSKIQNCSKRYTFSRCLGTTVVCVQNKIYYYTWLAWTLGLKMYSSGFRLYRSNSSICLLTLSLRWEESTLISSLVISLPCADVLDVEASCCTSGRLFLRCRPPAAGVPPDEGCLGCNDETDFVLIIRTIELSSSNLMLNPGMTFNKL